MRRQDAKTPGRKIKPFRPWRLGVLAAHFLRCGIVAALLPAISAAAEMKTYDTPYYIIHTDLDQETEKEAALRLTRMAEEYHNRTKDFAGAITEKLPFYFYRNPQDYLDNGGPRGSAGVFISAGPKSRLLALADPKSTPWHTLQHEGFHQFAHATIGDQLPVWLNEGLADYFAEGIFTGDGFVVGIVLPWRLTRLKESIAKEKLRPIRQIMLMSPADWSADLNINNYDQAWSMVHFLVHGDSGKYQQPFSACIREISQGQPFEKAWLDTLGPADGFESRWKTYWLAQPQNPSAVLYSRASVSILTSFLARASVQNQTFNSFDGFTTAAASGKLKMNPDDWLPPSLLSRGLQWAKTDQWKLRDAILSATMSDGTHLTGSYVIHSGHVQHVDVTVRSP
jgi:hypothetical protein